MEKGFGLHQLDWHALIEWLKIAFIPLEKKRLRPYNFPKGMNFSGGSLCTSLTRPLGVLKAQLVLPEDGWQVTARCSILTGEAAYVNAVTINARKTYVNEN